MSYTDTTENLGLPIYVASDKPSYLGDWNETMNKLDTGYGVIETVQDNVEALETTVSGMQTAIDGKAPTMHAAASTQYGAGSASQYGHVKLTDDPSNSDAGTAATMAGVAAAIANAESEQADLRMVEEYQNSLKMQARNCWILPYASNLTNNSSIYRGLLVNHYIGIQKAQIYGNFTPSATTSSPTHVTDNSITSGGNFTFPGMVRVRPNEANENATTVFQIGLTSNPKAITINSSITEGDDVIVNGWVNTGVLGGSYVFVPPTETQIDAAVAFIVSNQGTYDYASGVNDRMNPTAKKTDCSGIIAQAFKSAGIDAPMNYATSQAAFGSIVAYALAGEDLDLSLCQKGDILCFANGDSGSNVGHVAICTANGGTFYHQNSSYNSTVQTKGPQPLNEPGTFLNNCMRFVVRWKDVPYADAAATRSRARAMTATLELADDRSEEQ